ncbi:hypothetical protein B566_EDAN009019 [Ephemera danica]|nr:hypothetical protein B566_EDAN009019 [Ephemera danica]
MKNAAEQQLVDVQQTGHETSSSWGRRILRYNLVAARNAEKIPVSDEDELHDEDDVELADFSDDVDTEDSDADETRFDTPVDVVGEAMRDHCYSQPPSLMDRNGNYNQQPNENVTRYEMETASKWLASVHSFVPQQSSSCPNILHIVPPTSSCCWVDVARRSSSTTSPASATSVETRRARDELDAAEALTSLARAAREIVISLQRSKIK